MAVEIVKVFFILSSVCLMFMQSSEGKPSIRNECSYSVSVATDGSYRVNNLSVLKWVCIQYTDYVCNIPWLQRYCPGNVRRNHCFRVSTELGKIVNSGQKKTRKRSSKHKSLMSSRLRRAVQLWKFREELLSKLNDTNLLEELGQNDENIWEATAQQNGKPLENPTIVEVPKAPEKLSKPLDEVSSKRLEERSQRKHRRRHVQLRAYFPY